MVSLPKEFRASLESYTGPLDLLLYLIKMDEVDIFDIPISRLVAQYAIYLEVLTDVDPNACGEFLVMAARLMEIKSRMLLPREVIEEDGDEPEDPRIELVRQLLEYKKFKERALLLERRLESHRKRYLRPRIDMPELPLDEQPLYLGNVGVWDLLTAFHRIEMSIGARGPHHVTLEERSPESYIDDVLARLEHCESKRTEFDDLFSGLMTRSEACGYFLAILQLAKEYRLIIEQADPTAKIFVALREVDEATRLREEELERDGELALSDDEEREIERLAADAQRFRASGELSDGGRIPTREDLDRLARELGLAGGGGDEVPRDDPRDDDDD